MAQSLMAALAPGSGPSPGRGVLVAHPGTQHSYELAFALHQAGLLERYATGFYYKPDSARHRALSALLSVALPEARARLVGHRREGLPPDRVTTRPLAELIYVGSVRTPWFRRYSGSVLAWRNERFDDFVADLAARLEPAAVACFNSCALEAFQRAKCLGALRVLDQSVGDVRSWRDLCREEAELSPEFAEGEKGSVPQRLVERDTQEAALADVVLAGSEYVKSTLVGYGVPADRVRVVPYGVDTERFIPATARASRGERLRLLFVGQIGLRKGVRYLLEAVRRIASRRIELTLVGRVVGSGRGLAAYRDYFTYVPHAPFSEMRRLFQQADAFVFPSLHEGSALCVYEALACGLPVITTPNSGSVVRDGIEGFIVPIRDVGSLIEKISLLHREPGLCEAMSANARKRAEEFTWTAYHRRVAQVFAEKLGVVTAEPEAIA